MEILKKVQLGSNCKRRSISAVKFLVIHRIGIGIDAEEIAAWYAANPQYTGGKMPYHTIIKRDGTVEQAVSLNKVAPGATFLNYNGIQIALVGDFRKAPPTPAQAEALVKVAKELCNWMGTPAIVGHTEVQGASANPNKVCPGKHLNLSGLRDLVYLSFNPNTPGDISGMEKRGWVVLDG